MTKKNTNITTKDSLGLLVGNVQDFANAAKLMEEEITRYDLHYDSLEEVPRTDGRTHHEMWGSMKAVSHFNLGIALELFLKLLTFINGKAIPQGHELTVLHDDLPPPVQQQLEFTYQDIKQRFTGGCELIAFLNRLPSESPPEYPSSLTRDLSSLRDFLEYFDQDVKLSVKRYSYELIEQHQWCHYLSDLTLFTELIKHVLGNIERYIVLEDGTEHGETGMWKTRDKIVASGGRSTGDRG